MGDRIFRGRDINDEDLKFIVFKILKRKNYFFK